MRDRIFIPLAILIALGLVGVSTLSLFKPKKAAAEAVAGARGLEINAEALNLISENDGFPVTEAPGPREDQIGPRLAAEDAFGPEAKRNKGARLSIGTQTAKAMTSNPFSVVLRVRANAYTGAKEMALGVVGDTSAVWTKAPVQADFTAVRFDFPAQANPPRAFVFWASTQGKGEGIELASLTIVPQGGDINAALGIIPQPALSAAPQPTRPDPASAPNWAAPTK